MKKIKLGRTNLEVTELCFGALPMGPLQKKLDASESSKLVERALRLGVTFVDTAMMYKTYEPIRLAMERTGIRPVISDKSHMTTYEDMEKSVKNSLEQLDVPYVDIYLLHAARVSDKVFDEREGAYRCLLDCREKGLIKNVGISTHAVDVVHIAASNKEIDVVFPIYNKIGLGILRGTSDDMRTAIEHCFDENKGVYLMKALGGGNLIHEYKEALDFSRKFAAERAAQVLGMVEINEVDMNVKYFNGEDISEELSTLSKPKKIVSVFENICKGCGRCLDSCHSSAIEIIDGKAKVNEPKCLKCGYCAADCPEFAIRVI